MAEYENGKGARPLPYPLRENEFSENTENALEPASIVNPTWFPDDDQDEQIDFVVRMSLAQFTAIASAIDIGRDIGYGERSYDLWRTWCKALIGEITLNCADVADCVESELVTNETLINQLTQTINNNGFGNPNRVNPTQTKIADRNMPGFNDEEIKELENCNLDKLWGGIRNGIVDRLDEQLADTLQDISAIPTIIGRNAAWLDIIPVLGDLAEAVVTSLSSVAPTLLSLYEAHSSEASKDELACELFSMVCSECRYPTHAEIYDHFKNFGMPETPAIADWVLETMTELLTNPVGVMAKVAYFTLMTLQLGIMYLQATFNGPSGSNAILRFAELGEDFENNNWISLCDSCAESYVLWTWDFRTQGQGDFYHDTVNVTSSPLFVAGQGWYATNYSTARRWTVALPFNPDWQIRAVAILTSGTIPSNRGYAFRPNVGVTTGELNSGSGAELLPAWTRAWEGLSSPSGYNEASFFGIVAAGQTSILHKVSILFNVGHAPAGNSVPTNDLTPYTTP